MKNHVIGFKKPYYHSKCMILNPNLICISISFYFGRRFVLHSSSSLLSVHLINMIYPWKTEKIHTFFFFIAFSGFFANAFSENLPEKKYLSSNKWVKNNLFSLRFPSQHCNKNILGKTQMKKESVFFSGRTTKVFPFLH